MADGCNLYFTEKDLKQVEKSLDLGDEVSESKKASDILNGRIINSAEDFLKALDDPKDPRHAIIEQLIHKSLSNGKLRSSDEDKLAAALSMVLHFQKNPSGLFQNPPKTQGPGADSMKHGGELLSTAAIIRESKIWGGIRTSLGNKLHLDKQNDIIGFGQKLPAYYALPTRKKGTIEADTLISRITRHDPIFGNEYKRIAIDTKYIKYSRLSIDPTYGVFPGLERQLKGIRNAFNDESIQEFYFVSNVRFSDEFKDYVKDYNIKIFKDNLQNDSRLMKGVEKHLTEKEKQTYIPKEFAKLDLHKNYEAVEKAAREYKVPQIGYCEYVNF